MKIVKALKGKIDKCDYIKNYKFLGKATSQKINTIDWFVSLKINNKILKTNKKLLKWEDF